MDTGEVLMLAYMNAESLRRTLKTGTTWFFSRSRNEYWNKGATSGHFQKCVNSATTAMATPCSPSWSKPEPPATQETSPVSTADGLPSHRRDAAVSPSSRKVGGHDIRQHQYRAHARRGAELSARYNVIPVVHRFLDDTETPVSAFLKLRQGAGCFLLESAEQGMRLGRYSFLGIKPGEACV